jgi:hypothetical protein
MPVSLEPAESRIDRTILNFGETELVKLGHQLVAVRLTLGKQAKKRERQDPFQELAVMDSVLGHEPNIAQ